MSVNKTGLQLFFLLLFLSLFGIEIITIFLFSLKQSVKDRNYLLL